MKRKILGVAAIVIAGATSAFTVPSSAGTSAKFASLKWFSVSGSIPVGSALPRANATYLGQGTTAPTQSGCNTTSTNQCISGFDASKVNPTTNQLINDMQVADDPHYKRN